MSKKKALTERLKKKEEELDDSINNILSELQNVEGELEMDFDFVEADSVLPVVPIPKEEKVEEREYNNLRIVKTRLNDKLTEREKLKKKLYVRKSARQIRKDQNDHIEMSDGFLTPKEMSKFMEPIVARTRLKKGLGEYYIQEDAFSGIKKVIDLPFDQDHPTRLLIHMTDAPCYGKAFFQDPVMKRKLPQFYNRVHPRGGNPTEADVKWMFEKLSDLAVHYFFIQVPTTGFILTNTMVEKFKRMYEVDRMEFSVFQHTDDYLKLFVKAISDSIKKSRTMNDEKLKKDIDRL